MIQWMLAIWSLVPPTFLNPACISEYSWFRHFWSLAWKILNIILLAYEVVSTFFGIAFFGIEMKTDLFHPVATVERVFQICWHIECSTLTETSIRILNSSTRISSPPLALFVVMLPKAHLMSCSRMSDSRWVGYIFPFSFAFSRLSSFLSYLYPRPNTWSYPWVFFLTLISNYLEILGLYFSKIPRIQQLFTTSTAATLIQVNILFHLEYCNRLLFRFPASSSASEIYSQIKWK